MRVELLEDGEVTGAIETRDGVAVPTNQSAKVAMRMMRVGDSLGEAKPEDGDRYVRAFWLAHRNMLYANARLIED